MNLRPWHPPCWSVAPSLCPLPGAFYSQLRIVEKAQLERGIKVRIIVFDVDPQQILCVAMYPSSQHGPTTDQLVRLYQSSSQQASPITPTARGEK